MPTFCMAGIEPEVHAIGNQKFSKVGGNPRTIYQRFRRQGWVVKEQHDGDRLRILMSRAGISQAILANALEVSPTAVSTTWLQRGNIGREHIPGICRLLRCTADELLGLVPIATPMAVAEARSSYMLLKPDAKIMLEKYLSADDAGKDALQKVGDAIAQPTPARKVRVNR